MSAFDNATLMITGGTGSFGSYSTRHDCTHALPSLVLRDTSYSE